MIYMLSFDCKVYTPLYFVLTKYAHNHLICPSPILSIWHKICCLLATFDDIALVNCCHVRGADRCPPAAMHDGLLIDILDLCWSELVACQLTNIYPGYPHWPELVAWRLNLRYPIFLHWPELVTWLITPGYPRHSHWPELVAWWLNPRCPRYPYWQEQVACRLNPIYTRYPHWPELVAWQHSYRYHIYHH